MRGLMLLVLITAAPIVAAVAPYAGAVGGIANLSGGAGSQATAQDLTLSSYSASGGGALNVFAGAHIKNYFSLQLDYVWNENNLLLNSASAASGTFYQQARSSSQNAGIVDFLVYFRARSSRIRRTLGQEAGSFT